MGHHKRDFESILQARLQEPCRYIQCLMGPRQVGKTSGVLNLLNQEYAPGDFSYNSCEEDVVDHDWFVARLQHAYENRCKVIVFDEIQKMDRWSERVKLYWDQQRREPRPDRRKMHWVLLGSSSLQLNMGLGESLAGRFEVIPVFHWQYGESKTAFGLSWKDYLLKGGYPGSYPLLGEEARFRRYMVESIFESVITKDIMRHATIKKPALFRQTFTLASQFPGRVVSYNKLLGQLQDAGNVDQIKHYLNLFAQAYLLRLVFGWGKASQSRSTSPKLLPGAPVWTSLFMKRDLTDEELGRVFEAVVGNRLCESFEQVFYWREGHQEVDFVTEHKGKIYAIEVKSKARKTSGLASFKRKNPNAMVCMIDMNHYSVFEKTPADWVVASAV